MIVYVLYIDDVLLGDVRQILDNIASKYMAYSARLISEANMSGL